MPSGRSKYQTRSLVAACLLISFGFLLGSTRSGRFDDSLRLLQEYEQQVSGSVCILFVKCANKYRLYRLRLLNNQNSTSRFQHRHNAALAKYARDGAKDTDRLLQELTQLFQESLTTDGSNVRPVKNAKGNACVGVSWSNPCLLYRSLITSRERARLWGITVLYYCTSKASLLLLRHSWSLYFEKANLCMHGSLCVPDFYF